LANSLTSSYTRTYIKWLAKTNVNEEELGPIMHEGKHLTS
jgi:hypothetical protein